MIRLERRGGAAEYDRGPRHARPLYRYLPRVVTRRILLLIAGLVLFVHHNKAKVIKRAEHRGTRPYHDPGITVLDPFPLVETRAFQHARMKDRDPVAETGPEALYCLRRKRYLRHKHDAALPFCEGVLHGLQVYLGLAASRYAVQQENLMFTFIQTLVDVPENTSLLFVRNVLFRGEDSLYILLHSRFHGCFASLERARDHGFKRFAP